MKTLISKGDLVLISSAFSKYIISVFRLLTAGTFPKDGSWGSEGSWGSWGSEGSWDSWGSWVVG